MKKIAYGIMSISIVLIVAGSFSSFLKGLKEDHNVVLRKMDDVTVEFETFSTNTSIFEETRDELYNEILGNTYFETMFEEDQEVKNKISNYEQLVDELTKSTKKLDRLCEKTYFPKGEVNNMCINYKSIYEQVINYFVTDMNTYNENIKKYNEYEESLNSQLRLEEYKTTKKYIDYNGDKMFDGKE